MKEKQETFNLNECMLFKVCYSRTEANMAIRRSVRPLIKAINKSLEEAKVVYEKQMEHLLDGRKMEELSEDEKKKIFTQWNKDVYEYNETIFPAFSLERESSKNFFIRYWTQFAFNPKADDQYMLDLSEEVDTKLVEIYPDLDIDLDAEPSVEEQINGEKTPNEDPAEAPEVQAAESAEPVTEKSPKVKK